MSDDVEEFERENVVYIDDVLILKFIKVFSRAEYALKNVNIFRKPNKKDANKVEANWDDFAKAIHKKFYSSTKDEIVEAREYLLENPPKKQKIKAGSLWFDDKPQTTKRNTQQVLLMVRRVRNNLFHGGKYTLPPEEVKDIERNKKLIESSIKIIKVCMKLDSTVYGYYKVK